MDGTVTTLWVVWGGSLVVGTALGVVGGRVTGSLVVAGLVGTTLGVAGLVGTTLGVGFGVMITFSVTTGGR